MALHPLTKYINGHRDVHREVLMSNATTVNELHDNGMRYISCAPLSPMSAFLILPDQKTQALRMERSDERR